jgi:hypothetical protein
MSTGQRGKWAEGKVREALALRAGVADFNFMRLPDTRAGSFQPTTADFLVAYRGRVTLLEVKEVQHAFRLPRSNYPQDQRSRVRAWEMAGVCSLVVVAFLPFKGAAYRADREMWKSAPLAYFTGDDTSSWDMRDLPLRTLDRALDAFLDPV